MSMYRSKLEEKVSVLLGEEWQYEDTTIYYTQSRKYKPDFRKGDTILEVKGFFRPGDQSKYLAIRDAIEAVDGRYIMVFPDIHKPVRKGARLTHGKWCEKHGIEYYAIKDLKEIVL